MHAIARNNKYLLFLRFRAFLDMSLDCTCSSESQQNTTKLLGNTGFMKLSITAMCHSQEVSKGCCCYLFFFFERGWGLSTTASHSSQGISYSKCIITTANFLLCRLFCGLQEGFKSFNLNKSSFRFPGIMYTANAFLM